MLTLPVVPSLMTFEEACGLVVEFLREAVPLGFWAVSRVDGDEQVFLHVHDDQFGVVPGASIAWPRSFCERMASGQAPNAAPDAMAVPSLAATAQERGFAVGAYLGVPIRGGRGELFGTLCGIDRSVQPPDLVQHEPVLRLLAGLLARILQADRLRTEAAEREAELAHRAFHDELTGLANRPMFLDRLGHALDLHRRDGRPLAVLLVDIDDFKAVNDTFGHAAGDELLVRLAERLTAVVRTSDTLARLGGDEFAVLVEDSGDAGVLASRAVAAVEQPFGLVRAEDDAARTVDVGISVGLAELGRSSPPLDLDALMARADVAMYSAKRAGKGRATRYDPAMVLPEACDLHLREPLRRALDEGDVQVAYQPVLDLAGGEVVGFEALARWRHGAEDVPPAVFVPVAERGGLLGGLTGLVLDRACGQLARWSRCVGHARLQVAVNVRPATVADPAFPAAVAACTARHGLEPGQLVLELTEDALLADTEVVGAVCRELDAAGVLLSLDDFGTGYSSLLHLRRIPLHSLKIDRGFTADLESNPRTQRFIQVMLTLGRDLGVRVVVEGVERGAQAAELRRVGATHVQGHLYARALPPAEAGLLLAPS